MRLDRSVVIRIVLDSGADRLLRLSRLAIVLHRLWHIIVRVRLLWLYKPLHDLLSMSLITELYHVHFTTSWGEIGLVPPYCETQGVPDGARRWLPLI